MFFSLFTPLSVEWPLTSDPRSALRRRSRVGARDDGIGVRDDRVGGLRKFSSSRERSELSIFLSTLHAPFSTVLNRTLDLSQLSTLHGSQEHTPHRKRSPPLKRGFRSIASRSAREAELARRSRTGIAKRYWPPKATGGSRPLVSEANSRSFSQLSTLHGSQENTLHRSSLIITHKYWIKGKGSGRLGVMVKEYVV